MQGALSEAWRVLADVCDPEIPVVSVLELGIVRDIRWDADDAALLVVTVTPTYSGCPATEMIATAIRSAFDTAGFARVRIETSLVPAWTTEWITPEGRRKLRDFGIAPPDGTKAVTAGREVAIDVAGISPLRRSKVVVACPRCASKRTELVSQFGSTACKAHYRCLDCLEPFDYFKPH
ncbi:MAG TPA: 1,2-phenylacetyl-CoA epoxidase subunit PaaD [Casimicrobiaceae bacterium]|nr:1,2-phenylacetyl-CoA epoxidase subunit PaaD [Casimicrobiaceae bacterium]